MGFELTATLDQLGRTPGVLDALLRGTAEAAHAWHESPDTWSVHEVVGHLVHGEETDWVPRARIVLEHGDTRSFEPFDRFAQLQRFAGWSLDDLLDRFAELRRSNLETVRGWHLTAAQLALTGRHPELGKVTLGQLLATWAVHDLNHLAQINRVLARRSTEDVGPWRAYLSVLNPSPAGLLAAVLDAWERGNTALIHLVRLIPEGALAARAMAGSPTVAQMFLHLHHERMVSVFENAPEWAGEVPAEEWQVEEDAEQIVVQLEESARRVRDAVRGRIAAGRGLDSDFAHPIQLIQFLIFHDGYHHGQIKLALKAAGCPIPDAVAGPRIWDVWRAR